MPDDRRPGPQRPLLLHRLGGRVEGDLRPRRWLAAGARRRFGRRAAASASTTPTSSATAGTFYRLRDAVRRRTTCTPSGTTLRNLGKRIGAKDKAYEPVWQFAPGRAARRAAVRRHDHGPVPGQHDHLQVRPQDEHLPALGHRRGEADRRRRRQADRAEERGRDADAVRAAQRRPSGQAPASRPTVIGSGTAWIATNGRTIKGTWKKTGLTEADPASTTRTGDEVTLTVGQTFVQVLTTGRLLGRVQGRVQGRRRPPPPRSASPAG